MKKSELGPVIFIFFLAIILMFVAGFRAGQRVEKVNCQINLQKGK